MDDISSILVDLDQSDGSFSAIGPEQDFSNPDPTILTQPPTDQRSTSSQRLNDDRTHNQESAYGTTPAWTELKTKAGKERKRLPLACIACRRKKIKCSGEKPACKHCVKARTPCVFKITTRKAAPRTDYMMMLDKRLKRMEERVIKIVPSEEMPDLNETGRSSVRPQLPGVTTSTDQSTAGQRSAEQLFDDELAKWTTRPSATRPPPKGDSRLSLKEIDNKLLTEGSDFLPPVELQQHLAEVFFDCVYGQSYLLLHKPSFMRKLRLGLAPPVLILAVCAIAARFSTHPQMASEPAFLRGEQWATPARKIVEQRHFEPNITILTVMIILGLHYFGTCEGGLSWSFGGQAMRMGYALQLHKELDLSPLEQTKASQASTQRSPENRLPELSFTDREIRRRTMWSCFLMDTFNSSGTERPSFLDEDYMSIQLPTKEAHFQREIPSHTQNLDGHLSSGLVMSSDATQTKTTADTGVAAYVVKAVVLWKRIIRYLNLGGKEKDPKSIWDPSSQFYMLVAQVAQLRSALPADLTYTPENLNAHATDSIANQFLFLHILIAHNDLFLHRFAIPTLPNTRRSYPSDMPRAFVAHAAITCLDAATEISKLIADSAGHTLTVPFAGYCAYTSATVHVWGMFSEQEELQLKSKANLRQNLKYLSRMKRYWGMMHYMVESIKDNYRAFADAASHEQQRRAQQSTAATAPSGITNEVGTPVQPAGDSPHCEDNEHPGTKDWSSSAPATRVMQYSDWFEKYPTGVSLDEWEREHGPQRSENAAGTDAVLSQRSDLQSVEEFFASLSPPSKAEDGSVAGVKGRHLAGKQSRYGFKERNTKPRTSISRGNQTPLPANQTVSPLQGSEEGTQLFRDQPSPSLGDNPTLIPQARIHVASQMHDMEMPDQESSHQPFSMSAHAHTATAEDNAKGSSSSISGDPVRRHEIFSDSTSGLNLLQTTLPYHASSQLDTSAGIWTGPPRQTQQIFNYSMALPQLDRQMVFDGHAGIDPSSTGATNALNDINNLEFWLNPWTTQIDIDGYGDVDLVPDMSGSHTGTGTNDTSIQVLDQGQSLSGYNDSASSAWFLPFNLDPPDADNSYSTGVQNPEIDYGALDFMIGFTDINMPTISSNSPAQQPQGYG